MLEPLQLAAGFDSDLLEQDPPGLLVDPQRIGLPSTAVQGQHPQPPPPLPQRLLLDEALEDRDDGLRAVAPEPGLGQIVLGVEPDALEPGHQGPGEVVVLEVSQRPAPPQRQPRGEQLAGLVVPSRVEGLASGGHQRLEPQGVDAVLGDVEDIAGPGRAQAVTPVVLVEELAEA